MKISELTELQKGHLAWRLHHKTNLTLVAAGKIAHEGLHDHMELTYVFERLGERTSHSAKIHASKVINFKLTELEAEQLRQIERM